MRRLAICALLFSCTAHADMRSLISVDTGSLPPLQHAISLTGLATIQGRIAAFGAAGAFVLDEDRKEWRPARLEMASGQAIRVVFGDGVRAYALCGATSSQAVDSIGVLTLVNGVLRSRQLASLPTALVDAHAATRDGMLSVVGLDAAGGGTVLLQLESFIAGAQWKTVAGWPGGAASSVAQQGAAVYVTVPEAGIDHIWRWSGESGWVSGSNAPGAIVPNSARAIGQATILYLVREAVSPNDAATKMVSYHTITGSWATLAEAGTADANGVAAWNNGMLWARADANGAIAFGYSEIEAGKVLLNWLDWVVIAVYLAGMIGIGMYFYLRDKNASTSEFFVGGRSIPFWAAGVSLYAANTSSISFIAIPAKAFETNWTYMANNLTAVVGLVFVAIWIVPLLRRLDLMSVFSYLETRFHPAIRMLASALCIAMQLGSRMSVILYLPALAIATITGIDVTWSILLMGGFTIVYTALGGMKAVIWTDVVQVVVKMGGAIFAIGFIVWHLHGGFGEFAATALAGHKTKLFDFRFDLTRATVWGFLFLVLFDVVLTFPKDQVLMQRVLSTPSDKEAGRSIWAFAAIMVPGGFVFYTIGTALFVFYKTHPERVNPLLPIDATFPLFIAAELPSGVTGLIIAGIFAAAMATLSGIMNSVATLASVDFYEKLVKSPDPRKSVRFAEVMTVVAGLVGIGIALLLSRFDVHSLFDVSIELAGLLGGGFAGAYTLGMFTRRANSPGVAIGIASSMVLTLAIWSFKIVHPYFYLAISILLCIVIGYLASLLFPPPAHSLAGLTIFRDREP
ncbi:MAG: sodium:solute symporter [Rudaea sp.]|uniref:sodium:solute symporter n=1 Tax=Rudaea sp. TaxID=2136325 RepID=UPI0039E50DC7